MHIGRQSAWIIESPSPDETNCFTNPAGQDQVVAPNSDLAMWTAGNSLSRAAWGWHGDIHHVTLEDANAICFDQCVDRKSRSILALAPTTVAAMHDERVRLHPVTHVATGTSTFVGDRRCCHVCFLAVGLLLAGVYESF